MRYPLFLLVAVWRERRIANAFLDVQVTTTRISNPEKSVREAKEERTSSRARRFCFSSLTSVRRLFTLHSTPHVDSTGIQRDLRVPLFPLFSSARRRRLPVLEVSLFPPVHPLPSPSSPSSVEVLPTQRPSLHSAQRSSPCLSSVERRRERVKRRRGERKERKNGMKRLSSLS